MGRRSRTLTAAASLVGLALVLGACVTGSPSAAPTVTVTATPTSSARKSAPPSPATEAADPLPEGPVNALLVGTDSRDPKSLSGNSDIIMLMHLAADRQSLALVSFTRDMWVTIPGIGEGKINSAFARGGTPTLVDTVSHLLGGLDIGYVVQTNFNGFIAVTRALGGFTVENRNASTVTVQSTGRELVFPEGPVELTGTDGLIYVRQRKGLPLGDLDRTERQRAAVIGILERINERLEADPVDTTVTLLPLLAHNVKITGDLQAADLPDLLPLVRSLTRDDVTSLMVPITGFGNMNGASVNVVDTALTAALGQALRNDDVAGYAMTYGTDYAP